VAESLAEKVLGRHKKPLAADPKLRHQYPERVGSAAPETDGKVAGGFWCAGLGEALQEKASQAAEHRVRPGETARGELSHHPHLRAHRGWGRPDGPVAYPGGPPPHTAPEGRAAACMGQCRIGWHSEKIQGTEFFQSGSHGSFRGGGGAASEPGIQTRIRRAVSGFRVRAP